MYHQLVLTPEDRPLHWFLWRNLDVRSFPQVYEFSVRVRRMLLPFLCSVHMADTRWELQDQVSFSRRSCSMQLLHRCYMTWYHRYQQSRLPSTREVSLKNWASWQAFTYGNGCQIKQRFWKTFQKKTEWNANEDTSLDYSFTPDMEFTKRNVLKKTATNYNPLGFLAPYLVRAKLLIQQAWIKAADWDDPLPDHHHEQWKSRFQESTGVDRIRIPPTMFERQTFHSSQNLPTHVFRCFLGSIRSSSLHSPRVFRWLYHGTPYWIEDTAISIKGNKHSPTRALGGGDWLKVNYID